MRWRISSLFLAVAAALMAIQSAPAADDALFARIDANSDGQISSNEITAEGKPLYARLLRTADKNRDGKLTKEEFEAGLKPDAEKFEMSSSAMTPSGPGGMAGGPPGGALPELQQALARIDADKNGKISESEAPPRLKANFKQFDKNGDGQLDRKEMGAAMLMARPGTGAPGNPKRPGTENPKRPDQPKKKKE